MAAQRGLNPVLAFVLGAVVVGLIVAGYVIISAPTGTW